MLPKGLSVCALCGQVGGRTKSGRESLCLCDGIVCRRCGVGRTHRPISDYFDARDGKFWHTSYLGALFPCGPCRQLAAPLEDPRVDAFIDEVRSAAEALAVTNAKPTRTTALGITAVHGTEAVWSDVRLPPPPDDRPLWIGAALAAPPFHGTHGVTFTHLDVARPQAGALIDALVERWLPP